MRCLYSFTLHILHLLTSHSASVIIFVKEYKLADFIDSYYFVYLIHTIIVIIFC